RLVLVVGADRDLTGADVDHGDVDDRRLARDQRDTVARDDLVAGGLVELEAVGERDLGLLPDLPLDRHVAEGAARVVAALIVVAARGGDEQYGGGGGQGGQAAQTRHGGSP